MKDKISARRYGRLLAILYLNDHINDLDQIEFSQIPSLYIEKLTKYLENYEELPTGIQQQILRFASKIISDVIEKQNDFVTIISQYSKNRSWNKFLNLDKALLLVGIHNLQQDPASHLIIKEILIVGDILGNQHAAPYISGILKSIAFSKENPQDSNNISRAVKQGAKIRLKPSL